MKALSLNNVSYKPAGAKKALLSGVDISFEAGKVYAISGMSSAGKSGLLALLSGLGVASEGRIEFDGENLAEINRNHYRSRKIGVIFQSMVLLLRASAIENIVLSMKLSGVRGVRKKVRALELLDKVGISPERARCKIQKLTVSEQQRVAVARALAHDPSLIIADEPTGSADKATQDRILEILQSLAHVEKKCVIVITHSKRVTSIADEVLSIGR